MLAVLETETKAQVKPRQTIVLQKWHLSHFTLLFTPRSYQGNSYFSFLRINTWS